MNEDFKNKFGQRVDQYIKLSDRSYKKLAEEMGVSYTSVISWKDGVSFPRVPELIKLGEIFNCSLDELILGKESIPEYKEKYFETLEELQQLQKKYNAFYEEMLKNIGKL